MYNAMKKIFLIALFLIMLSPSFVHAATGTLTNGLKLVNNAGYSTTTNESSIRTYVGSIINAVLGLLGTVFLVLLVYGGYLWMTAGGNEEDVGKAKKLIAQAILGLAVIMGAYAISYFVTSKLETATGL